MAWWLSHRIPVIGYPMEAYVELAQEVGYPAALLNLTSAEAVRGALRRIASPRTRGCLQTAGWRAAELLSPQQSALQLLRLLPHKSHIGDCARDQVDTGFGCLREARRWW